jgi:hypothetical protein
MAEPNPDAKARKREYYLRNRDRALEYQRQYELRNRERKREYKRQWNAKNRDKNRGYNQKYRGLGLDFDVTWAAMWDAQQGRCYLCERPMDPAEAVTEHWHGCAAHESTGSCRRCQRGLAHSNCNRAIGFAGDDPAILRIIADNLERANADIKARQAVMPQHIPLF